MKYISVHFLKKMLNSTENQGLTFGSHKNYSSVFFSYSQAEITAQLAEPLLVHIQRFANSNGRSNCVFVVSHDVSFGSST